MPANRETGLKLVRQAERKIAESWGKLRRAVTTNEDTQPALDTYRDEVEGILFNGLWNAYLAHHPDGGEGEDFAGLIRDDLKGQSDYLQAFMLTLFALLMVPLAERGPIMDRNWHRGKQYAGAIWAGFVKARTYQAPPDSLWQWTGPDDNRSCRTCSEEVRKPPRPLSQMVMPGRDPECGVNCRHDLQRVVKKSVPVEVQKEVKIFAWR